MGPRWPGSEDGRAAAVAVFAAVLFAAVLLAPGGVPAAGPRSPVTPAAQRALPRVLAGVSYVFLSYYEDQCGGRRPSPVTWGAAFRSLHALYPRARVGFGEIAEDCRPYATRPMWRAIRAAFLAERAALH